MQVTTSLPAIDEYITGMTEFNAPIMWDALDQQAIQAMQSQGSSETQLRQRLDGAKQKGGSYEHVAFVGGNPLARGDEFLIYVVSRAGSPAQVWPIRFSTSSGRDPTARF